MSFATLTPREERELVLKWQRDRDEAARDLVISRNLHLVRMEIPNYADKGVPVEDLEQEGWLGLCRAIDDHDPGIARFCTHAIPWVKAKMREALYKQGHTVRAAFGAQKLAHRYRRLAAELGRTPTREETTARLNISDKRCYDVVAAASASRRSQPTEPVDRPTVDAASVYERVEMAMADVHRNQRLVIESLWGLGGAPEKSMKQIADENGFEPWQVDRMLKGGLKSFRKNYEDLPCS